MKIVALMENTACAPQFAAEHGLSLYIEAAGKKILFDTGSSSAFADNAALLGVDLAQVDMAVLSHGHYDHGGGLQHFLRLNEHSPVYLSRHAFGQYYRGDEAYIGIDQNLRQSDRLILVDDELPLAEGLTLLSCNNCECRYPLDSAGLTEQQDDMFLPDQFRHEQYLLIEEGGRRVLISGCSHKGILNIMEWLRPDVLVGGFHFMKQEVADGANLVLDEAAQVLAAYNTEYYTCHCTGLPQFAYLQAKMGDKLHYLAAGQVVEI